jgi:hypothetical protein
VKQGRHYVLVDRYIPRAEAGRRLKRQRGIPPPMASPGAPLGRRGERPRWTLNHGPGPREARRALGTRPSGPP